MRVLRGRAATPSADHGITSDLVEQTASTGESTLRVWTPHRQVAFGRRDRNREGYDSARSAATEHGFAITERAVGGHAVAFTGSTVAFARIEPVTNARTGIKKRYETTITTLVSELSELDVEVSEREPEGAFCPGTHSLSAGGKIVGLAQRIRQSVAVVAGIVIVDGHDEIADVLEPIYAALDIPFERTSVGSIARAGGDPDPQTVIRGIEDALTGGEKRAVEQVRET